MDVGIMEGHPETLSIYVRQLDLCVKLMGGFHYLYIRWDAKSILTVILHRC